MIFKFHKNQADVRQCGRFRRAIDCANTTHFFDDVYERGTRGKKAQVEEQSCGRSMVEMLGVLAIIGVLSVGAIAGYSKAMTKYKMNKHAEAFNIFLNNIMEYVPKFECTKGSSEEYYGDMLQKLNLIPDSFKYTNKYKIYDNFSTAMWVYAYCDATEGGIGIELPITSFGQEICQNIVQTAKENASSLRSISTQITDTEGKVTGGNGLLYGDSACTKDKKCLRNLTLDDVSKLCQICTEGRCRLYIKYPRS